MPKYAGTLHETVEYQLIVEAPNQGEAEDLACQVWCNTSNPVDKFDGHGHGIDAVNVEEIQ